MMNINAITSQNAVNAMKKFIETNNLNWNIDNIQNYRSEKHSFNNCVIEVYSNLISDNEIVNNQLEVVTTQDQYENHLQAMIEFSLENDILELFEFYTFLLEEAVNA